MLGDLAEKDRKEFWKTNFDWTKIFRESLDPYEDVLDYWEFLVKLSKELVSKKHQPYLVIVTFIAATEVGAIIGITMVEICPATGPSQSQEMVSKKHQPYLVIITFIARTEVGATIAITMVEICPATGPSQSNIADHASASLADDQQNVVYVTIKGKFRKNTLKELCRKRLRQNQPHKKKI